jgi:putative endonuclease
MYWVYAISSNKKKRIYVGMSEDVEKRLKEHNFGQVFSTKGYRPWTLIYVEKCGINRTEARAREKYFKSGIGKEFLKTIPG